MVKEKRELISRKYAKRSKLADFWHRYSQNKAATIGLFFIVLLALNCIFADVLYDYETQVIGYEMMDRFQGPSAEHWFGTDDMGRDLFFRIMYGAKYSMAIAVCTVLLSLAVGMTIGAIAGFFGGKFDLLAFRFMDIIAAIPSLMMGIIVVSAMGQSTLSLVISMSIVQLPNTARTTRTAVMTVKNNEYVEAARAIGMPKGHIILRHIIPNCLSTIVVRITLNVAAAIAAASSLSFIGLGVPVPSPEWGALLSAGRAHIRNYSYMTTFPGLAIMITIMALNMMGDGLRDALDPKLRK